MPVGKLRMGNGQSQFGAPLGTYRAKFVGAEDREHPEYGAGIEWKFEITDGPHAGKVVSRTTSPEPTMKNSCGKLVNGLAGGTVKDGAEFDPGAYVGRLYVVTMEANSTGNGTRVGTVMPAEAFGSGPPAPAPAQPPAPPRPPRPQPAPAVRAWWVATDPDKDSERMTDEQLVGWMKANGKVPAEVYITPLEKEAWQTADLYGFKDEVPF